MEHTNYQNYPSSSLLLRRGWIDPFLYIVIGIAGWLVYIATDIDRNNHLEKSFGYSGQRMSVIILITMFLWGTIQGLRGKMVVYINDDSTPNHLDATATFAIVFGAPIVGFIFYVVMPLLALLLLPTNITPPNFESISTYLTFVLWAAGLLWMYARLYAYNRNALCAATALVARLGWCFFAFAFLNQAKNDLENERQLSTSQVASNFIMHMILFLMALFIIGKLTYDGPPLRHPE
jgi:hypothetical protein